MIRTNASKNQAIIVALFVISEYDHRFRDDILADSYCRILVHTSASVTVHKS
jgi:hypothetical protein